MENARQFLYERGDEEKIELPPPLSPGVVTRSRASSFTVATRPRSRESDPETTAQAVAAAAAALVGENGGESQKTEVGGGEVSGGDKIDDALQKEIQPDDSASNASSSTSSIRRRRKALQDKLRHQQLLERHRLEKEKEEMEEKALAEEKEREANERKLKEEKERKERELKRKKEEMRRREELVESEWEIKLSEVEVAGVEEMEALEEREKEGKITEKKEEERESTSDDFTVLYPTNLQSVASAAISTTIKPVPGVTFIPSSPEKLSSQPRVSPSLLPPRSTLFNPRHSSNFLSALRPISQPGFPFSSASLQTVHSTSQLSSHLASHSTSHSAANSASHSATYLSSSNAITSTALISIQGQYSSVPTLVTSTKTVFTSASVPAPATSISVQPNQPFVNSASVSMAPTQTTFHPPHSYIPMANHAAISTNALVAMQQLSLSRPKEEERWSGEGKGEPNVRVFLQRFSDAVELSGATDRQIFDELLRWTKGKANKYVKAYRERPPADALLLAKQRLLEFFAAIPRTAIEVFDSLKKGKAISFNDKDGFQLFACELEEVENGCFINNDVHLLDTVDQIIEVVQARLPKLQRDFSRSSKYLYQHGGVINYQFLKSFVFEQIADLSMPGSSLAFEKKASESKSGGSSVPATKKPETKVKMEKTTIAAAEVTSGGDDTSAKKKGRAPCAKCGKMHSLYECPEFKEKSALERKKFCYDERVCFRCVNSKTHPFFKCPMDWQCHCGSKSHHRLICLDENDGKLFDAFKNRRKEEREKEREKEGEKEKKEKATAEKEVEKKSTACSKVSSISSALLRDKSKLVLCPVVSVEIVNPSNGERRKALAILDSGSNTTCIVKRTAEQMGFSTHTEIVEMSTVFKKNEQVSLDICEIRLQSLHDKNYSVNQSVVAVDHIPVDVKLVPTEIDIVAYPHLRDVKLNPVVPTPSEVEILIGCDLSSSMAPEEGSTRRSTDDKPSGYRTRWGWCIMGPSSTQVRPPKLAVAFVSFDNGQIHEKMTDIFSDEKSYRESDGMLDAPQSSHYSIEDLHALKIMQETVKFENGKYDVGALWNKPRDAVVKEMAKIPSRETALRRLHRLGHRLKGDKDELAMVQKHVQMLVDKGYAEEVGDYADASQNEPTDQPCFYIPLLPVQDRRKPEKRRITHDCSAKTHQTCLNDFFFKGPDLVQPLSLVLLRFRENPWALMGDIEAFFMRVGIPDEDKDAFRTTDHLHYLDRRLGSYGC